MELTREIVESAKLLWVKCYDAEYEIRDPQWDEQYGDVHGSFRLLGRSDLRWYRHGSFGPITHWHILEFKETVMGKETQGHVAIWREPEGKPPISRVEVHGSAFIRVWRDGRTLQFSLGAYERQLLKDDAVAFFKAGLELAESL